MVFISIIIPFNKGKRYLKDCLESLKEQNLSDEEIILIINGNNEYIDDLLNDYPNIIIKYFDNEIGVAKARNEALEIATGKYIYFIDSDDYIFSNGLSKLIDVAHKTNGDFINGERINTYYIKDRFLEEFELTTPLKKKKLTNEEFSFKLVVGENTLGLELLSVLHSLIKKDKINNLRFNESKRYNSDYEFMIDVLNNCNTFFGVEDAIYAKRISDDPINLKSLNQEEKEDEFLIYCSEYKQSKNKLTNDLIKQEMDNKLFNYYYVDFAKNFISNPNNKWRTIYFDELCELANNFNLKNINLIQKIEFKALKSKNKKIIQHLARIRINYHRTKVLIKELNRFPTFIYQKILNKRKINENKIIFESFSGNFYSDNPKYLYEYLYEHYSDNFEFVWVINDKSKKIPGNPKKVKRFSLDYFNEVATSKYLVTNTRQAGRFIKRSNQILISTWHGTPLKKLGFDIGNIYLNNPRTKERYLNDSKQWDYFISPNKYSTDILKRSFAYDGEMLEKGYPRNDILYNISEDKINSIKNTLNIPKNKKIILYAPTWRDDDSYDVEKVKFQLKLELNKLQEALADEYIILVRTHYLITDSDVSDYKNFAFDVSNYDDIAELFLISDILITDYSSVLFDFANLRRPILFYTYDLEEYESEIRGFYIDIHNEVPGPLLKTTDEVINAIKNIEDISEEYKEKYDDFYNKFCMIEDGNASKRIVDAIWVND
ncbi:bifunctional glycosyltransferase/CDP-glycerol:glycerophosphate glycerophosphotransferase [Methanobrevibacter oralis]|uniref:CDP-glycerol:poly(Glycerophosphate) glycerophosphotransferase n=1 Tax=Methanobrevibacter oralis TaxID=66851 RepID=A0A166AAP6_METOA|nr:bifunctional glycosyltransferase family 2 protein/CDP-glycerol:glycerophosphate glycerophosphotransferase [Methanobrevibacter oralis]KZX11793.1 CDP-glycerol:poly(glycerophosphate) glycerophosphotransferase [Methanobrevibacter oralis]